MLAVPFSFTIFLFLGGLILRLFEGDCLDVLGQLPEGSVDLVLADPPYGTTRNRWDTVIPVDEMWRGVKRVLKPRGVVVLTACEPFTSLLVSSNLRMFRYDMVWRKPQGTDFLNSGRKPLKSHENILVFYRKQPDFHPQYTLGTPYKAKHNGRNRNFVFGKHNDDYTTSSDGRRCPTTVLNFNPERGLHATQKPVELMRWLIRTYTSEGATVLDFCMGSGSTGVACAREGREFIGIEKDPEIFSIAKKRLEQTTSQNVLNV